MTHWPYLKLQQSPTIPMSVADWKPSADLSNLSPNVTEFRKRSFPQHMIEAQKQAAITMAEEKAYSHHGSDSSPQNLSFVQRHFYRPTNHEADGAQIPEQRRFSFLSRGFLVAVAILFLMVAAILCAVLATVYERHYRNHDISRHPSPIHEAIVANFPDPTILKHDDLWYAFATNNAAGILKQPQNQSSYEYGKSNVQLATSTDFSNWTLMDYTHDPLPVLGTWVNRNFTNDTAGPSIPKANVWAPAILKRPSDGKFVLYYAAATNDHPRFHCVGAAVSNTSSPAGPYVPIDTPLACPIDKGGAIDPAPFVDTDGTIYVAWKIDGNNIGHGGSCGNTVPPLVPTPIMLQKMKADGTTADGDPIQILDRNDSDGPLVEAPALARSDDGSYFLFFSSGCTRAPTYDLKYAFADNITGPYTRADSPLLSTGDWGLLAPGSVGIARNDNGTFEMAFHARVATDVGRVRAMFTTKIEFNNVTITMSR